MAEALLEAPPVETPATTPPPAPAPEPTADERAKLAAWFDRSIGVSEADARKSTDALNKALLGEPGDPSQSPAEPPVETPEAATPPVETPPVPTPKRVRKPVEASKPMDAEELAVAVGKGVATALEAQKPKPLATEPVEVPEPFQDEYETIKVLETLNKRHEGLAERYKAAVAEDHADKVRRTKEYIKTWQKDNPGQVYDAEAGEHTEFFNGIENEPLPDLGYTEAELKRAERQRIKNEVRDEMLTEVQKREADVDRRVRGIESRDAQKGAQDAAAKQVLGLLKVDDVSKADDLVKPIYEDAAVRAETFAGAAFALVNGIWAEDLQNPLHAQVRGVTSELVRQLDAADVNETIDEHGRLYANPKKFGRMTKAERGQHWTVGAEDVIEFGNKIIADQAQKQAEAEQVKWETIAKNRGYDLKKPKPAAAVPPPPVTRAPAAIPSRINAPSLSAGIKTPANGNAPNGGPQTIMDGMISRF